MKKVYISSHDRDLAEDLAKTLRAAGHLVVSLWHAEGSVRPPDDDMTAWEERATANFALIDLADSLVVIAGPDRYPGGKFFEAGYAFAKGVEVLTLGRFENGMLTGTAGRTQTVGDLIDALDLC